MTHIIGMDIGQANDFTALVAVEKKLVKPSITQAGVMEYHVPHLERLKLHTEYPDMIDDIKKRITAAGIESDYKLVADATGVGKPVIDFMRKEKMAVIPIIITGGNETMYDIKMGGWHVPKRDLISSVQIVLQNRSIKFSDSIEGLEVLIKELMNFKIKVTAKGNDTYEAWRDGDKDDLVLSLSMAIWYAMNHVKVDVVDPKLNINPWLMQKGI